MQQTGKQKLGLLWDQRGITGLETAIVLIAFVVVSSVFAFAALSTGLFSSDKSKETISAGLAEARGTLEVRGGLKLNGTLTVVSTAEATTPATGDGSITAFVTQSKPLIPGTIVVRKATVTQTEGTDYTVVYDTGTITFTSAPASGNAIDATYTHYTVDSVEVNLANAAGGLPVDLTPGETVVSYQDNDTLATGLTTFELTRLGNADADNFVETGEVFTLKVTTFNSADSIDYGLTDGDSFTIQIKPPSGAVVNLQRTVPDNIGTVMELN